MEADGAPCTVCRNHLSVLSTLPWLSEPLVNLVAPFNPVVEILSGDFRIFSGEGVELKCTVPDHISTWQYRWFKGSEELHYNGQTFVLWKARVDDTGKYSCQGVRDTVVGDIRTLQSVPVEIIVDGGWALTHVTPQPALVGRSLEVTCRVRGKRPLSEVILYRDGVEVMRNQGNNPKFLLSNLTIEDQGMYSCRASWNANSQTHSVISAHIPGMVREVLSKPLLEIIVSTDQSGRLKLVCHHEYNLPAPAPPLHFYFYRNKMALGTAASKNQLLVRRTPGQYSCKVRVPALNLVRWSEPRSFGQVPGPQAPGPSVVPPRPPNLAPVDSLQPARAGSPPQKSAVAPRLVSPQDVVTQWSVEPAEATTPPSTTPPSTTLPPAALPPAALPPTVPSLNQTAALGSGSGSETSGYMSGESGDFFSGNDGLITE